VNAILDPIEIEDLPGEGLRQIARIIGIDKVKELIVKCPGQKVYIPKSVRTITNKRYAADNFTGNNYQDIADHLGITARSVRRLLGG